MNGPASAGPFSLPRLGACSSSPTASSAVPTSRSPRRCSAPPRRRSWSSRSWRSRSAGRGRGCAQLPEKDLFVFPRALEVLLGALGLAVFLITVYAGLAGTDGQSENLAPTAVYVSSGSASRSRRCSSATSSRAQPVARARPRDRLEGWCGEFGWSAVAGRAGDRLGRGPLRRGAGAAGVPRAPRPHPRRGGDLRLRDLRAVLGERDRARPAGDPDAPVLRRDARGDEPLRRRGVDAQRGRVRRAVRPDRLAGAARPPRRRPAVPARPVHRRGAS